MRNSGTRRTIVAVFAATMFVNGICPPTEAADCGWVLWVHKRLGSLFEADGTRVAIPPEENWSPRDGFAQLPDCQRAGRDFLIVFGSSVTAAEQAVKQNPDAEKNFRELGMVLGGQAGEAAVAAKIPGPDGRFGLETTRFACFPSGTDPRPR
jgi:hypothetical protein